jgi:hypothetical protein
MTSGSGWEEEAGMRVSMGLVCVEYIIHTISTYSCFYIHSTILFTIARLCFAPSFDMEPILPQR